MEVKNKLEHELSNIEKTLFEYNLAIENYQDDSNDSNTYKYIFEKYKKFKNDKINMTQEYQLELAHEILEDYKKIENRIGTKYFNHNSNGTIEYIWHIRAKEKREKKTFKLNKTFHV